MSSDGPPGISEEEGSSARPLVYVGGWSPTNKGSVCKGSEKSPEPTGRTIRGTQFRIGATTMAATVGMEDSLIQTLGRWKSTAYLLYVELDPSKLAAVSRVLATSSV